MGKKTGGRESLRAMGKEKERKKSDKEAIVHWGEGVNVSQDEEE